MFDRDYFAPDASRAKTGNATVGMLGGWGLYLAHVAFLLYSGYHGIQATATYRAAGGLGAAAGIVGIVVIELVLFSLFLAWHNQRITGASQSIAAGITYAVGFALACLGIVADSQLQAGMTLSPWLSAYLRWMLPIAPAIMALGALLTHELAPEQLRARREAAAREAQAELQFNAQMAGELADLETAKVVRNVQLNAKAETARQIAAWYSSPAAQQAINRTALHNAPAMLRAIGIHVPGDYPDDTDPDIVADVDLEDLVSHVVDERVRRQQHAGAVFPAEPSRMSSEAVSPNGTAPNPMPRPGGR